MKDLECTTDRWAKPLESDDPIMAKLRPLLAGEGGGAGRNVLPPGAGAATAAEQLMASGGLLDCACARWEWDSGERRWVGRRGCQRCDRLAFHD